MLHGRMSDLVYVKFNSRLKHKRENKAKDPIEKQVIDILKMMTMNLSLELHLQQMMNKKNQKTPKLKVRKNRNKRLHQ